jgi:hypothetical protein
MSEKGNDLRCQELPGDDRSPLKKTQEMTALAGKWYWFFSLFDN